MWVRILSIFPVFFLAIQGLLVNFQERRLTHILSTWVKSDFLLAPWPTWVKSDFWLASSIDLAFKWFWPGFLMSKRSKIPRKKNSSFNYNPQYISLLFSAQNYSTKCSKFWVYGEPQHFIFCNAKERGLTEETRTHVEIKSLALYLW